MIRSRDIALGQDILNSCLAFGDYDLETCNLRTFLTGRGLYERRYHEKHLVDQCVTMSNKRCVRIAQEPSIASSVEDE